MGEFHKRASNNGLRKICGCSRRKWAKCPHDWHFNFTWRRKPYRFSLDRHLGRPLSGKTEAEREATRLRAEIQAGQFGTEQPQLATLTLRQLLDLYVERRIKVVRPLAVERDQDARGALLRQPLPRPDGTVRPFGDWLIADIITDTIERFRERRSVRTIRQTPRGPRRAGGIITTNRNLALLRALFNWALALGYTDRTPFKRNGQTIVKLAPEQTRRRRLEPGEGARLVAVLIRTPWLRLIMEAAIETGCRGGELLSLQWWQVRFDPRADIVLPAEKTKTARDRRVPISARFRAILEMLRTDPAGDPWPPTAYVFGHGLGRPRKDIKTAWETACRRAGIVNLHFHDLRREAGSRWLEAGVPLQVIRDWLGHANVSQTSTYLAATTEGQYEAMRRFDAVQHAHQHPLASDCIAGSDKAPFQATNGPDAGQETTENIEKTRTSHDNQEIRQQGGTTMAFRREMIRTRVALGIVLTVSGLLTASAQAQRRGGPPPYTPAPGAKDLRAVLFNWTSYMGMLRGVDEHELIVSLEYQGNGTIQVDGQPCTLTKYRASANYQTPGQRIQYTCTRPNGQTSSNVEVVNGQYAWNEDIPGAEIVPGKGKATPMPNAVQERLIRLWASPQGAPKAALTGVSETAEWGANPATLQQDGVATAGKTSLSWEAGKPVVTFPIPGVPGATATATLDAKYMAERVVVKQGATTTEFIYGNYQDWNNPLNKVQAHYAGKMVERRNGTVGRDLTTVQTETGSVYVVMPVPASVQRAITVTAPAPPQRPLPTPIALSAQDQPTATPRLANGKPDLTGNWGASGMNWRYGNRRCGPTEVDCTPAINQTMDFEFEAPSRFGPNRPVYKPEHWDKVQQLDMWTNKEDPVMTCQPLGLPRHGAPRRIIQSANDVVFLYGGGVDGGGGYGEYRVIPTDGSKHDPKKAIETTYYGYTVGNWESDTLVLDSISFVDTTWLARGGFFHSDSMHIVEKFTRQGNQIKYEVTVEDPEVLAEPWVMTPRTLRLNPNPAAGLLRERGNCEVYEEGVVTSQIRH